MFYGICLLYLSNISVRFTVLVFVRLYRSSAIRTVARHGVVFLSRISCATFSTIFTHVIQLPVSAAIADKSFVKREAKDDTCT